MFYTTLSEPVNVYMTTDKHFASSGSITANKIIQATSKYFNIPEQLLRSPLRKTYLVRARRICAVLIDKNTKLNDSEIAPMFCRDRTFLNTAREFVEDELSVPAYRQQMNEDLSGVMAFV